MPLIRRALVVSVALAALGWGSHTVYQDQVASRVSADGAANLGNTALLTVSGGGYGHGRGMSQYGAAGAARQGLSHQEILAFYYPGTTLVTQRRSISVLISADTTDDVVVVARPGLTLTQLSPRRTWTLPATATRWRLVGAQGNRTLAQRQVNGTWRSWRTLKGEAQFKGGGPVSLVLPSGAVKQYRGALRSGQPRAGSVARDTVNVLTRENYLRGVVAAEMPASWPAQAVRSQAVAARTYAAHEQNHPLARHYQVCDTTRCQVYGGVGAEHPLSTAAIRATSGQILTVRGAPAFTQFGSSNGGWTVAGAQPHLVAQEDPYDDWSGNPVHRWEVPVQRSTLRKVWPSVGRPTSVQVLSRDGKGAWGGRVGSIRITGAQGSVTVSGDDFRLLLGLRSTYFTVSA